MQLIGWVAARVRVESLPGNGRPQLEFAATLQCLNCGKTYVFPSSLLELKPTRPAPGRDMPADWTGFAERAGHMAAVQLSVTRSCVDCGSLTVMPEAQKNRLRREVTRMLTDDWLEKHAAVGWQHYNEATAAAEEAREQFRLGLCITYDLVDGTEARDQAASLAAAERRIAELESQLAVASNGNGSQSVSTNGVSAGQPGISSPR